MTLLVLFLASGSRDLKTFYPRHVAEHLAGAFPRLVRDGRFVELQRDALVPRGCDLHPRQGRCTGIAFVDATTLAVCHNLRIPQHKVYADCARRGRSSMGWCYGFKLHLVINDRDERLGCYLTPDNATTAAPCRGWCGACVGPALRRQGLHQPAPQRAAASAGLAACDAAEKEHAE